MEKSNEALSIFGFTNHPEGLENECAFFDYGSSNKHSEKFEDFRKMNDEMREHIQKNKDLMMNKQMIINRGKEGLRIMVEKDIQKFIPVVDKSTIREPKICKLD